MSLFLWAINSEPLRHSFPTRIFPVHQYIPYIAIALHVDGFTAPIDRKIAL